ncbi:hypothetical protein BGY98DRAFT_280268 [Russula aff. rugulosa BPL654]|nr:hypothetical protein BGY98DRAFT_280268 [Russula aff. rugulosa BPL654]
MYLFGTPIRRTDAACHYATPGCIRLKLYSSKQEQFYGSQEAVVDDVVDFPLERNGDLDFERVKLWWGVKICAALEPYNCKVFQQGDPNKISGIAIHNLTAGTQNAIDLICKCFFSAFLRALDRMLTITNLKYTDVPTETDEYKRNEQGSWIRELKWHRRMFVYDPAWYFNRLLILCALFWLFSLIPGSFAALNSTFVALKSAAISLIFTFSVAARWMREVELTLDPRMTEAILRSLK